MTWVIISLSVQYIYCRVNLRKQKALRDIGFSSQWIAKLGSDVFICRLLPAENDCRLTMIDYIITVQCSLDRPDTASYKRC